MYCTLEIFWFINKESGMIVIEKLHQKPKDKDWFGYFRIAESLF